MRESYALKELAPSSFEWLHTGFAYCLVPGLGFFLFFALEVLASYQLVRKTGQHPLVSGSLGDVLLPRFILNLIFAGKAAKVIEQGYHKFKESSYQLIRQDGSIVLLPVSTLDELTALPATVASPHGALEHDLLGPYTGLNLILESRMHHSIIQRRLTPRLNSLTPFLEGELKAAFEDYFPTCDDSGWVEFQPYQIFGKLSARLSARALVGPEFCRDSTWLDISFNYTENLFRTMVILRLFPSWLRPMVCGILPSYWRGQHYIKAAKRLLGPKLGDLIIHNNDGSCIPDSSVENANVLYWLAETAKGKDRDPSKLAHVEVLLALASVHTTLLRMVNVLYDLTANPQYVRELQLEIQRQTESQSDWDGNSYSQLRKLDSVLRESQRMSPPTILGLKRFFKESHTFSNGLHIPKGTYTCMPTYAIENDPKNNEDPEIFEGFRYYHLDRCKTLNGPGAEQHQFSSVDRTALNFGYGKSACPGRFFASLVIKMLFVKLLTEYEFSFMPGQKRPKNILVHEFLFCWPWQKMLVKRRTNGSCPS